MPPAKKRLKKLSTPKKVAKKKPSIRAGKAMVKEPTERPYCPKHQTPMVFDTGADMVWRCTDRTCSMVAYPQVELGTRKPVMARGELEVIASEGAKHVYIRATESNVFVDVSDCVLSFQKIGIDTNPKYTLTLQFDAAYKVSDNGDSEAL